MPTAMPAELPSLVSAIEPIALAGDREGAVRLYDLLQPHDGTQLVLPHASVPGGSVAYYLAVLSRVAGRLDVAARHLEHALAEHLASEDARWEARVRCEYARLLLTRGDPDSRRAAVAQLDAVDPQVTRRDARLADEVAGLRHRVAATETHGNLFRRTADIWTIRFGGTTCHVRDTRGVGWLVVLLERPWEDVPVEDLDGIGPASRDAAGVERARVRVTRAIRTAIKRIAMRHPMLGTHLARSIHTGRACAYRPDLRAPIPWST